MAKKQKSSVKKSVEELIIKAVNQAKDQERGPGADKLLAIARLLNSYARLRGGGSPGNPGRSPGSTPKREEMSEKEWREYCEMYGEPGHYESLL